MTWKSKALFGIPLLLSPVLAMDEFLPVGERIMQVDLGIARSSILGIYGSDWENNEMENPNNPFIMPLQGKFGLSEGLEGSLGVDYIFEDHNGNTGLDRPVLAIKYADSGMGAGGFIALTLPIGFEEILKAGNFATFTLGGLYGKRWGDFGLLANASYSYSTEDEDENKRDQVDFFAKPGYSLPFSGLKSRNQDFQVNLGLRYTFGFNHVVGGEGLDTEDHLFTVQPGVHYLFNSILSAELKSHFTVSGQNQAATNGVELKLYFTLEEKLYNAISG
jgi:hypothetical protein